MSLEPGMKITSATGQNPLMKLNWPVICSSHWSLQPIAAVFKRKQEVIAIELVRVVMVTNCAAKMKGLAGSVNWLG